MPESLMPESLFVHGVEVEQAAAALSSVTRDGVTWQDGVDQLCERYGLGGWRLAVEYEYVRGVGDGCTPHFVVLH